MRPDYVYNNAVSDSSVLATATVTGVTPPAPPPADDIDSDDVGFFAALLSTGVSVEVECVDGVLPSEGDEVLLSFQSQFPRWVRVVTGEVSVVSQADGNDILEYPDGAFLDVLDQGLVKPELLPALAVTDVWATTDPAKPPVVQLTEPSQLTSVTQATQGDIALLSGGSTFILSGKDPSNADLWKPVSLVTPFQDKPGEAASLLVNGDFSVWQRGELFGTILWSGVAPAATDVAAAKAKFDRAEAALTMVKAKPDSSKTNSVPWWVVNQHLLWGNYFLNAGIFVQATEWQQLKQVAADAGFAAQWGSSYGGGTLPTDSDNGLQKIRDRFYRDWQALAAGSNAAAGTAPPTTALTATFPAGSTADGYYCADGWRVAGASVGVKRDYRTGGIHAEGATAVTFRQVLDYGGFDSTSRHVLSIRVNRIGATMTQAEAEAQIRNVRLQIRAAGATTNTAAVLATRIGGAYADEGGMRMDFVLPAMPSTFTKPDFVKARDLRLHVVVEGAAKVHVTRVQLTEGDEIRPWTTVGAEANLDACYRRYWQDDAVATQLLSVTNANGGYFVYQVPTRFRAPPVAQVKVKSTNADALLSYYTGASSTAVVDTVAIAGSPLGVTASTSGIAGSRVFRNNGNGPGVTFGLSGANIPAAQVGKATILAFTSGVRMQLEAEPK